MLFYLFIYFMINFVNIISFNIINRIIITTKMKKIHQLKQWTNEKVGRAKKTGMNLF